jgi:hypothetical protein
VFKDGLGYRDSGAVECALIDVLGVCWVRLFVAERFYSQALDTPGADVERYERRLTRTHRRFTSSLESLARVRRLLAPRGPRVLAQIAVMQQPARAPHDAEGEVVESPRRLKSG